VIEQILRTCRTSVTANGLKWDRLGLAVVGVPGVPDQSLGRVAMAPNVSGWVYYPDEHERWKELRGD